MGVLGPRFGHRIAASVGAVVVGDLVLGMASFSIISLGALWYFCLGWIRLVGTASSLGLSFGATWQLELAWFGAFVGLPLIGLTIYLGIVALRLPVGLYRAGRGGTDLRSWLARGRAARRKPSP